MGWLIHTGKGRFRGSKGTWLPDIKVFFIWLNELPASDGSLGSRSPTSLVKYWV